MDSELRLQRRRVRLFFAGLLVISSMLDVVGALLVQHQTRSEVLETLLPATITLGGRTGAVLSGLGLLLLATGIARGKRVAFRLTLVLLMATIAFELVKDLDFEAAALFAWILVGLWWFDIVVGLAFAADGRLEAFVSWLPVPMRKAWTLDLMRRRPDSTYGVVEVLIVRSIDEARARDVAELSLGMTPRIMGGHDTPRRVDAALRAMYWSLDRFQRSRTLHQFKEKFDPRWEDRYVVVPGTSTLPEVIVDLARAHVPPLTATLAWFRSRRTPAPSRGRPAVA